MDTKTASSAEDVLQGLGGVEPELVALYKDIHARPELSMHETRTAGIAADRLRAAGYEVTTGIGKTGVVGLLRNGDGPVVLLRADMDALSVKEATGLPYANTVTVTEPNGATVPGAHACGHDMHVACLVGAATLLAQARAAWQGTVVALTSKVGSCDSALRRHYVMAPPMCSSTSNARSSSNGPGRSFANTTRTC
jgi:hippurate hydrolase